MDRQDRPCWIMHMDMDAFFASIEQKDDPSLRGRPVIVGGGHRGVVSTCSYEARRFGVRSAMPMTEARRRCPEAVIIRPRMARYAEVSALVRGVLGDFSPSVEMASVDEAYLDATGMERVFGSVETMGTRLKEAVFEATGGLTCSVGMAPVKFLAKIASEQRKPDGLFIIRPEDMPEFLRQLPVTAVPGVGRRFAEALARMGVRTCGQAAQRGGNFWKKRFGRQGELLHERSLGLDSRTVQPFTPPKSESAESTLDTDTRDRAVLEKWLLRHAERVGAALRRQKLAGRVVTLKIKYEDFRQITRQVTLPRRICGTDAIYRTAKGILDALELTGRVRLIGVGVSGFEEGAPEQGSLLRSSAEPAMDDARLGRLDRAVDMLCEKYGRGAVTRGRLLEGESAEQQAEGKDGMPDEEEGGVTPPR